MSNKNLIEIFKLIIFKLENMIQIRIKNWQDINYNKV